MALDIKSLYMEEIEDMLKEMGEPKFRAKQIFTWLHQKKAVSFDEMTNLSKPLREKLSEKMHISKFEIADKKVSSDGTAKYLFLLEDGNVIESVLMRYSYGNAVCVSTQVGCRMGCAFCASTLNGLERNLTAGEILTQVYEISRDIGERISSVVLMGSGEPLDNYDNAVRFVRLLNSKDGADIGQRHITLSTCGLADRIDRLKEEKLQITLAISLHAPNDEIRNRTMPVSKRYDMETLLLSCRQYAEETKRRITFEYALIKGVNDSAECAKELASRLKGMLCHVNLIPVNDVKERDFVHSSEEKIRAFADILMGRGIETTVRRKLGSDINAACGQLRRGYISKQ